MENSLTQLAGWRMPETFHMQRSYSLPISYGLSQGRFCFCWSTSRESQNGKCRRFNALVHQHCFVSCFWASRWIWLDSIGTESYMRWHTGVPAWFRSEQLRMSNIKYNLGTELTETPPLVARQWDTSLVMTRVISKGCKILEAGKSLVNVLLPEKLKIETISYPLWPRQQKAQSRCIVSTRQHTHLSQLVMGQPWKVRGFCSVWISAWNDSSFSGLLEVVWFAEYVSRNEVRIWTIGLKHQWLPKLCYKCWPSKTISGFSFLGFVCAQSPLPGAHNKGQNKCDGAGTLKIS